MTQEDQNQIADALQSIATHLKYLGNGDAATTMGAIENHAAQVEKLSQSVGEGLDRVAEAIDKLAHAVENREG